MGIINNKPSYITNYNMRCACGCNVFGKEKGMTFCSECGQVISDNVCANGSAFGNKLVFDGDYDGSNE